MSREAHSAEKAGTCECGHAAFMHGDVAGDTGCRGDGCPCMALRTTTRTCAVCGTSWTDDVGACPAPHAAESAQVNLLVESDSGANADDGVGHRSAATDNATMMARIAGLYFRPGMAIADPMRGSDVFWKHIDQSLYDLRLTDITDGTDARMLPYADQSLHAVVLDPPYRYVETGTTAAGLRMLEVNGYNLESVRGKGHDGVMGLYRDVMREADRVLMIGGYMVVKCQDTITDGKQQWVHLDLMQFAASIGCEPIDLAVVTPAQVPPTRWKIQRSLRKSHSYFIVCRKGGRWPFGYKSVSAR